MFANNENNMQTVGTREDRGKAIAEKDGQIKRIDDNTYKVKSQSRDTFYNVVSTEIGWKCNCPDHTSRGVKCKHIFAVEISFTIRQEVKKSVVIPQIVLSDCLFCHSVNLKKNGIRHNASGDIQRFECLDCHRTFSINIGFEKMKHNPKAIT